jgi:hypothetical protein
VVIASTSSVDDGVLLCGQSCALFVENKSESGGFDSSTTPPTCEDKITSYPYGICLAAPSMSSACPQKTIATITKIEYEWKESLNLDPACISVVAGILATNPTIETTCPACAAGIGPACVVCVLGVVGLTSLSIYLSCVALSCESKDGTVITISSGTFCQ